MIIAALVLLTPLAEQPGLQQSEPTSGAKIISNMLAFYNGLHTLVGTIDLRIDAVGPTGNAAVGVKTALQFEKPNKLYLRQDKVGKDEHTWIVTSDGKTFSYNLPPTLQVTAKSNRLVEVVDDIRRDVHLDVAHIYAAAVDSIGDRSPVLGIAMSWNDELRRIVTDWPTVKLDGEVKWNGTTVWKITGQFKETPAGLKVGDYELLIDKSYNLMLYRTTQYIATPDGEGHQDAKHPIRLTQQWTVNLEANGKPNPSLFKVLVDK